MSRKDKPRVWVGGIFLVLALSFLVLVGGCGANDDDFVVREDSTRRDLAEELGKESGYNIYLITMNQASNYWQQIDAGCQRAVREIGGIDYHWMAPPKTSIAEQQLLIEKAVENGADAILLSAASNTELEASLAKVTAAGVKLIYVDSPASHPALITLATDNVAAGVTAAKTMQRALMKAGIEGGVIGLAGGGKGQATAQRDIGFRQAFAGTNFTVAPTFEMNGDQQNIKDAVKTHLDYVAFFGSNEQTTWAISEQVVESGISPIIVGFDTSDRTLAMLQQGVIYATMQQKPQQMGYEGVQIAVEAINGKYTAAAEKKDMGVTVITRDKI